MSYKPVARYEANERQLPLTLLLPHARNGIPGRRYITNPAITRYLSLNTHFPSPSPPRLTSLIDGSITPLDPRSPILRDPDEVFDHGQRQKFNVNDESFKVQTMGFAWGPRRARRVGCRNRSR